MRHDFHGNFIHYEYLRERLITQDQINDIVKVPLQKVKKITTTTTTTFNQTFHDLESPFFVAPSISLNNAMTFLSKHEHEINQRVLKDLYFFLEQINKQLTAKMKKKVFKLGKKKKRKSLPSRLV